MALQGVFAKLRDGLSKTRDSLTEKVRRLAQARGTIDDALLEKLEEVLISSDVGVATSMTIVERIKARVKSEKYVSNEELTRLLKDEIARLLDGGPQAPVEMLGSASPRPFVIMVVGVNGVGKTTTIGKLAARMRIEGRSVLIGAADTFRAAANEQLEIWAKRAGVDIVRQSHGSDPASVAFDTVSAALSRGNDVVIIDTAGRLHTKVNLMEELAKIRRVLDKRMPGSPHEVLLVLDATTGQNGLQQATQFAKAVGVTGLVLTKLDGTAKGGIVFAIAEALKIPVRYVGVGEGIDDLQPFDHRAFVDALFAPMDMSESSE